MVSFPLGPTGCCASCNNGLHSLTAARDKPLAPVDPGGGDDPVEGYGGYTNATHHMRVWRSFHTAVNRMVSSTPSGSLPLPPTAVYDFIDVKVLPESIQSFQLVDHLREADYVFVEACHAIPLKLPSSEMAHADLHVAW